MGLQQLTRWRWSMAGGLLCTLAWLAVGNTAFAERSEEEPPKECVTVRTEAPYVPYGYNHIVVLKNTCDTQMRCDVKTDVNPEVTTVTLSVGEEKKITTFVGSPSREFIPQVSCKKP